MTVLPKTETLILEREDAVLRVWFNRPERRNSLNETLAREMMAVLDAVRDDRSVRVLVLRGKGGIFCAGADLKGVGSSFKEKPDKKATARGNRFFGEMMDKLNELPQVVVMLVEGAAVGGGMGLSCVGDVTITTEETRFALSETSLGIPPAQIAPFVVQRIGLTQSRRLMLTGARFKGAEAVALGIAHFVVKDADALEGKCDEILAQIKRCAPGANATTKAIVFASDRLDRPEALDFAAQGFADCLLDDEGREGVAAFLEKRKPSWAGDS